MYIWWVRRTWLSYNILHWCLDPLFILYIPEVQQVESQLGGGWQCAPLPLGPLVTYRNFSPERLAHVPWVRPQILSRSGDYNVGSYLFLCVHALPSLPSPLPLLFLLLFGLCFDDLRSFLKCSQFSFSLWCFCLKIPTWAVSTASDLIHLPLKMICMQLCINFIISAQ